jgi:glycosidase
LSTESSYSSIYTHGKLSGESDLHDSGSQVDVSAIKAKHNFPEWAINAVLYEVNLRQFTPEGTIKAFAGHLPRIKALGVDIIWMMPVHPIGQLKRKGTLGSPYAVGDYRAIHPDYGYLSDFKVMVDRAHDLGLKVIIDWVANHTAWDHPWITDHPDYYRRWDGEITSPINPEKNAPWGWDDVAELDYDNPAMRQAMIDALLFWIREMGIDGFRFDVAHQVPTEFWEEATEALYQEKPLFLLAESEMPEHLNTGSFITNYAWEYMHLMNEYAKGRAELAQIDQYFAKDQLRVKRGFHIYFTTNHDENAWAGTVFERLGAGHLAFAVLAATIDGMPLIYGGQEAPIRRRLNFYERDPIEWNDYEYTHFYQRLFALKHRNKALRNGAFGGRLNRLFTGSNDCVFAFSRVRDGDQVIVAVNLSEENKGVVINTTELAGQYKDIFSEELMDIDATLNLDLSGWTYKVLEKIE